MKITIEKTNGKWELTFGDNKPVVKYGTLFKLAKALMQYAKGQKL